MCGIVAVVICCMMVLAVDDGVESAEEYSEVLEVEVASHFPLADY